MKLIGRIPVEPLDDERLTNIERRIVAGAVDAAARPMRASRRAPGFVVAAIAAVVIGVIGFQLGTRTTPAAVVAAAPPLRVDATGGASLDLGDARITGDPATVFVVTRPAGGVLVDLRRGKVELEVDKRGDRAPLVVRAGDTDVVVVGTRFSVDYGDGTGDVVVIVTEGVVNVVRHQHEVRVAAGHAWRSERGLVAVAEAGTARRSHDGGAPVASPDRDGAGDRDGTGDGDGAEDGIDIELGSGPDVLRDRIAHVPDMRRSAAKPATGAGGGSAARSTGKPATIRPTIEPNDPQRNLKRLIAAQHVEPALEVGEPSAAKAMSAYYTIIREQDGEAESRAFYSIAVTQATKLGRTSDALKTLDDYFRRFGRGKRYPEHDAALWLRLRIQCLRAIDDTCRRAAAAYATHAGAGPATNIARRIQLGD